MYCTACGVKNSPENNFCKQCGHKMDRPAPVKISEEAFDRALPDEEQVSALLERAYRLRSEGDVEGAILLCQEALRLKAESTSAHSLLGQLYAQQGEHDRAVQEYERVLQLNPGSIADRVKLDELRASDEPDAPARNGRTRIVLTEQKFTPESARNGLAIASIAIILMMAGGAFALKFWPQPAVPVTNKENAGASAGVNQPPGSEQTSRSRPLETERTASNLSPAVGSSAFTDPFGAGIGSVFSQDQAASAQQPRQNATPVRMDSASGPAGSGVSPTTLNVKEIQNPPSKPAPAPRENNNRIVLPSDDNVTEDGNGNYKIRVKMGNEGSNPAGGGGSSAKIRVNEGPGGNAPAPPDFGNPPRNEASTAIAMGNDLKGKGDFNRAIAAYQKALAGAGDEKAYVYQSIASCFQAKGDRDSAIYNYERAIPEWERLISEGRKADVARASIRTCEIGIRICRSE